MHKITERQEMSVVMWASRSLYEHGGLWKPCAAIKRASRQKLARLSTRSMSSNGTTAVCNHGLISSAAEWLVMLIVSSISELGDLIGDGQWTRLCHGIR